MNQNKQDNTLSIFEDVINGFSLGITIISLAFIMLMSLYIKRNHYEINKFIIISLISLITGASCYLILDIIRRKLNYDAK